MLKPLDENVGTVYPFFEDKAMETLAYMYGAEGQESEAKELNLGGMKTVVTAGLIAAGVTAGAVTMSADSASASHCRGNCYGGGFRSVSYFRPVSYYRPVFQPRFYHAYPVYYRPCSRFSSYY
jgi:hypothetical protein